MYPLQNHYHEVIQKDLVLSENVSNLSLLSAPKKVGLCLGGDSSAESYVISSLGALNIVAGQKPFLTQQKSSDYTKVSSKEAVGGKLILRGSRMYFFLHKLIFKVLPFIRQFEGLKPPLHENIYCFVIKDMFAFEELVPLFPSFENLGSLQCQFHFTTKDKAETVVLGQSLQLCFLLNSIEEKRK
uniref:Ribosomal protein L5 n=1 Tax=Analipus japonicus TaxID=31333 RepID=A0A8F0K289_9PHAE|nr:ribosomal protein L5 [Analipus japonicus]